MSDKMQIRNGKRVERFGCEVGESPQPNRSLVCFHESVDGFLAALWTDLQVVAIVRQRLLTPLAAPYSRRFHLRDLFEQ